MSQGERPNVSGAWSPPAERAAPRTAGRNEDAIHDWERLFPTLAPAQQQNLMSLALRQGSLQIEQLPAANGQPADRARAFIHALWFDGNLDVLSRFEPKPIRPLDASLDDAQRAAVAVAIQSPDVAVIRGLPGTGKSRVISEIIRQAVRLDQRVLVVASTSAGLDVILERIHDDPAVIPIRCLSREERVEKLSVRAADKTFTAYRRQLIDEPIRHVQLSLQRSEAAIARWRADLALLEQVQPLAENCRKRQLRRDHLSDRAARILDECERGMDGAIGQQLCELRARHEAGLDRIDRELAAASAQLHDFQKQAADAEAKAAAAERQLEERGALHRLLGLGANRIRVQIDANRAELVRISSACERAAELSRRLAAERDAAVRAWEDERRQAIDAEVSRVRGVCELEMIAIAREIEEIKDRFQDALRGLSVNCPRPQSCTLEAVEDTRSVLHRSIEREKHEVDFARRWSGFLAGNVEPLLARIQRMVNVVFASPGALQTDERLAEICKAGLFDLIVVDEAHMFSEAELLGIARLGTRWALVGDGLGAPNSSSTAGRGNMTAGDRRNPRSEPHRGRGIQSGIRSSPWARLVLTLEDDIWSRDRDGLCCRLHTVSQSRRSELETESVADSPDVKLRILTPPDGDPCLAEVHFPASTSVEQALEYLYRELNDVPVPNAIAVWHETEESLSVRFTNDAPVSEIELQPGVRVRLAENGRTTAIDFEPTNGWDRHSAENWMRDHARPIGAGRLVDLDVCHRMASGLVGAIAPIWFNQGDRFASDNELPDGLAVEFVAVPAHEAYSLHRPDPASNGVSQRGAGLESDLSDARQRDHLLRGLRANLPPRGVVNLTEARAVVSLLEERVPEFATGVGENPGSIAVLTMQVAQAELIRSLVRESPALARAAMPILVEYAGEFRQREADVVLLSLTRSHDRRAVSYSDDPALAALAATRARRRLILVGDPGALARRAHWDGPLDHLDETAADREKGWVGALLGRLPELQRDVASSLEGPP